MPTKQEIIKDTIRQFSQFPTRSIARYLLEMYGGLFDYDIEKIRGRIRYYRGQSGESHRQEVKEIIESDIIPLPETWNRPEEPYVLPEGKWLVISDAHIPFHSKKAIEAAIEYGIQENCTGVFMNGDMQDCQAVSYWPSMIRRNFMGEVSIFIDFLDHLRQKFPTAKIVYKPGNHEYRLPRFYAKQQPDLIGSPVAAMESLLDFESRDIEFLDYFQMVMAGKLPILHGHEIRQISRAVNPARGLALKAKTWAACSHFHTTSEHTGTNLLGAYLTTWSFGCLCDLKPEYCKYGNDWNHGFATIDIDKKGGFGVRNLRIMPSGEVR